MSLTIASQQEEYAADSTKLLPRIRRQMAYTQLRIMEASSSASCSNLFETDSLPLISSDGSLELASLPLATR